MNEPLLFRFHRGGLEESMKTVVEVPSKEFLTLLINEKYDFPVFTVDIHPYYYDERIKWNTHIVYGNCQIDSRNHLTFPVGYLNRKPDWM